MSDLDIVRAWKDEEFRLSLTDDQRAMLPSHPAGPIELDEELELDSAKRPKTRFCLTFPLSNCCTP
jgi:mersacidin/lichenicidin family type 2 lantibiotic